VLHHLTDEALENIHIAVDKVIRDSAVAVGYNDIQAKSVRALSALGRLPENMLLQAGPLTFYQNISQRY
jgi:hypothetical protein